MKKLSLNIIILTLCITIFLTVLCAIAKPFRLVVAGSTSMLPLSEKLASRYKEELGVDVLVQGGGSSFGINAVLNDVAQIAASSRPLNEEEQKKLRSFVIGKNAIAIAVHPSNPIKNISKEDLKKVLSGEITNWKELGIPINKPIQLVNETPGSGMRSAIEKIVMGKDKNFPGTPLALMSAVVNSSTEMKASIANSKYAVGYLAFNYLDDTVKALTIDNVIPSYAAAYIHEYPLFIDLYYSIKKDSYGLDLAYIYYVLSPDGQDVVIREGFFPIQLITSVEDLGRIWKREKGVKN